MDDRDYKRYFQLAEAAEMYFLRHRQQADIAREMNISRSLVSRMIAEAQEKGVVSIMINRFFRRAGELERELCTRYGLKGAGVLVLPAGLSEPETKRQLGSFTADLVYQGLSDGSVLGLTFGTTLKEAVEALSLKAGKLITCVQLAGSLGAAESSFDAHELVHLLTSSWKCSAVFLHAPFIVKNEEIRRLLFENRSNSLNAEMSGKMDVAVVGISSYNSKSRPVLFSGGHVSEADIADMHSRGIIGDVGTFSLNSEGRLVEIENMIRMIGLDEKGWKEISLRYALAFGEAKVDIIRAALKGGWVTNFITDEQTARLILNGI